MAEHPNPKPTSAPAPTPSDRDITPKPPVHDMPLPGSGTSSRMPSLPGTNRFATGAWILGLLSLVPMLGAPLGLVAIVLGGMGLWHANVHPKLGGKGQSITGIILGVITTAAWTALAIFLINHNWNPTGT